MLFKGQPYFYFLAYVCLGYWELLQLAPMPLCAPIIVELCFFGGFVLLLVLPYFLSQDAPGSSCIFPVPVLESGHFYGKWYWKPIPECHWKDWCWSSKTLVNWWEELTHWKRLWCRERLKAGEGDDRGWDGWMASWLNGHKWANSRRQWRTGEPGMLQSMGLQRVGYHWATELNWTLSLVLSVTQGKGCWIGR